MDVHAVHGLDDNSSVLGRLEVGKCKTSENAIVEMVVEGIGLGKVEFQHDGSQRFLSNCKWNVLDNDGGRDQLVTV